MPHIILDLYLSARLNTAGPQQGLEASLKDAFAADTREKVAIFENLLLLIERGEARGVLSWNLRPAAENTTFPIPTITFPPLTSATPQPLECDP